MSITNQSTLTSKITLPDQSEEEVVTKSNVSSTENMSVSLKKELQSVPDFAKPSEEVEELVTLTNESGSDVSSVNYKCEIVNAGFVAGSVRINNVEQSTFNPTVGFALPDAIAKNGGTATISYKVAMNAGATADATDEGTITYDVNEVANLSEKTNKSVIELVNNVIEIEKTSNLSAVIAGQTLTYQDVITNNGNEKNTNLQFVDPIPAGTTFVTGSVKVNDESKPDYNPATGFALSDLDVGQSIKITFDVTIDNV